MGDPRVVDRDGLRVLEVNADEAIGRGWAASGPDGTDADVVRVESPHPGELEALRANGFTVKPTWVTWGAPVLGSQEEFTARLSRKERRNIRDGVLALQAARLRVTVDTPLRPEVLDLFLALYEEQVAGMRHGVPYASLMRDRLMAHAHDIFAVCAHDGADLVSGCLCWVRRDQDAVRIAFSATRPDARRAMLMRSLYLAATEHARHLGLSWTSLGTDPTLYGHIAKPGLFTFKSRLGFVPVPLHTLDPDDDGGDRAERVLRLVALTDPALSLGYAGRPPEGGGGSWKDVPAWHLDVLTSRPDPEVRPYRAAFLDSVAVSVLPGGR